MFRLVISLSLFVSGCSIYRHALDLDLPESGFRRISRPSIDQPIEIWRNEEAKITCYRISGEGLSCIKE